MLSNFLISGKNKGAECVTGTQPIEVGEYWNSGEEILPLELHLNNLTNQKIDNVPDKFKLKPWFEIDNLFHSNGLIFPCEITFKDKLSGKENIFNFDPIFEYGSQNDLIFSDERFVHVDYFNGKNIDFDTRCIFYGQSISKGSFISEKELETEDNINESFLKFKVTQHEDILILLEMYYMDDHQNNLAPNIDNHTKIIEENFWFD